MSFLDTVFGRNKKPTTVKAATELARYEDELRAAPARIARAEAVLQKLADLSDEQHEAAIAELAAAKRHEERLIERVAQLRAALAQAEKEEAAAALQARRDAADKALTNDYPRLLALYEKKAAELADVAAQLQAIDDEAQAVNRAGAAARKAEPGGSHPSLVPHSTERFRSEPDVVEPDTTTFIDAWEVPRFDGVGFQDAHVFVEHGGQMVPTSPAARKVREKRVVPGRTRKGRSLPAPTAHLVLPAARLGADPFWPKKA